MNVPIEVVVYDYPTGVVSGEDEIAARRVEMTSNPAYGTVTVNEQGMYHCQVQITLHTVSVFTSCPIVQYLLLL